MRPSISSTRVFCVQGPVRATKTVYDAALLPRRVWKSFSHQAGARRALVQVSTFEVFTSQC